MGAIANANLTIVLGNAEYLGELQKNFWYIFIGYMYKLRRKN